MPLPPYLQSNARVQLPPPHATKSKMNFSKVQGWEHGRKPSAPEGFKVTKFADGFDNPRTTYVTPNGDILVAESNTNHGFWERVGGHIVGASKSNNLHHSADRITLLRDTDKDGIPDDWEKKNGLNPNDAGDASKNKLDKHYTNIEVYINSITK